MAETLFDKIWNRHLVRSNDNGSSLLYIDRHLIHEVTSPQAFEGLRIAGRKPWRTSAAVATPDHNVPTTHRERGITDPISRIQVEALDNNCHDFGIREFGLNDLRQGIVHVVGPEQGLTLPGMTVVCGDSHTSTHGALGAIAMGIGTSEVEHVLATQTLVQSRPKQMRILVNNTLPVGVTAKDLALCIIGQIGTAGGTGYAIEYAGEAIRALSMEGRMTLCNMTIEAGARCGMVAVDRITLDYVRGRPFSPQASEWDRAEAWWSQLHSDASAVFDHEIELDATAVQPQVSWGTSPEMVAPVNGCIPRLDHARDAVQRQGWQRALEYVGLQQGTRIHDIPVDIVFIGSCTNGRIEDIRAAAAIAKGHKVAASVKQALVVPGSGLVKQQAEKEGLDTILTAAGFEWRDPGCSMCLAMNADQLQPGEHCASTSNRNFEGRQGQGGRTHLVSPPMAAAAAIAGHFVDVREW
ncbi:MAG: 3-isopropylmalate dehydratase large subunit [Mariprofundales bacterium]|nr:3-isopropylmalate dehydratase large subunit [Mariprofundales bacterium]